MSYSDISGTFGSCTSDGCCAAAADAGKQLVAVLTQYKVSANDTWETIVKNTYSKGAGGELSVVGVRQGTFHPGSFYKIGVSCCMEAEIDVLTGEWELLSAECVHDGRSLNPAVDVGQVEGCLVQAIGFCLTEEVKRSEEDGRMLNNGT